VNLDRVAGLARTVLYEGYLLYPYRTTSAKNEHRWMFGTVYPRTFVERQDEGDRWWVQTEVLVRGNDDTVTEARARFLHLAAAGAVEREVEAPPRALLERLDTSEPTTFAFGPGADGCTLHGALDVCAARAGEGLYTLTARLRNLTEFPAPVSGERGHRRDAALREAFASAHVLLGVRGGAFVSPADPPSDLRAAAAACRNAGLWPILVGERGAHDTILAAPVILEDYPRLAPQSAGDFFDATEIDELLTLRILTLTDEEKSAMRAGDAHGRALLERTEAMADEQRRRLHAHMGDLEGRTLLEPAGTRLPAPGSRVRLAPRRGGDIFDIALAGRTATVVKVEENYEGEFFVAVTVDDDPGRDLGADGRPGHRFFFRPDEIELLP
jgi:hypothetical protein